MTYNPDIHHRRSIRLKGYDYSQAGLYFVTICTHYSLPLFGEIIKGEMILNEAGMMIQNQWRKINQRFLSVVLHESIVMPNHFHAIIELVGANPCGCPASDNETNEMSEIFADKRAGFIDKRAGTSPAPTIGDIVGAFKSLTTNEYIKNVRQNNWQSFEKRIWLRNYHEHIIRDENSYVKISNYVQTNPQKWREDCFFEDVKAAAMDEFRKLALCV
ncbi:MAG: transposase [Methylococcaceae bacterium]